MQDSGELCRPSLTALLKDGRVFKLTASGCDRSGGSVMMWQTKGPTLDNVSAWVKEAVALINVALTADIAHDIGKSLEAESFETDKSGTRLVLCGSPESYLSYTVEVSAGPTDFWITVLYVIG